MSIRCCTATSPDDLRQILELQQVNHSTTLSEEQARRDGFVTVMHSLELITQMNEAAGQIIAKDGELVAGYALVMLPSFQEMIPVLKPMFNRLAEIQFGNKKITDYSFYVMGQICIAEAYRGRGLFDALYNKHKELLQTQYDLCVTSVSTRNTRSMRAHERVGFQVVHTFRDSIDEWNILVWDWE